MRLRELVDLDDCFGFIKRFVEDGAEYMRVVDSITEADGIEFLCPKCFAASGRREGVHAVICWRPHVPQTVVPKPGRWQFEGTSLDDLTLVAGSSSVLLTGGCAAHFFVRSGAVEMC